MKKLSIALLFLATACTKQLDKEPQGSVFTGSLQTPENTDAMVIAAYSALGNDHWSTPYTTMWAYGSVRGGDAYKGGAGTGDQPDVDAYEQFSSNRVDIGESDGTWYRLYIGVARCNTALQLIEAMDPSAYPQQTQRLAEVRFLRAHFYFILKVLFNHIPWIDETIPKPEYDTISNRSFSSDELWSKIADDFRFAADNLPVTQTQAGRVTKGAAQAYLAKTLLYQAYTQDDNNNVTGTNQTLLAQVNTLCDSVINSGQYSLFADFADNFLSQFDNGPESVFAIQFSKADQTPEGRVDAGAGLDYPMDAEYGCCGFHQPSYDLVNAFQTGSDGLPLLDTYNGSNVAGAGDFKTSTFDPRLDHTVAIPGHPYKYQHNLIFQSAYCRDPATYNGFMSLKEVVAYNDPTFVKYPPFMSSSKNWQVIRYADVLLMKAEALIEMGQQDLALPLINQVRTRAAASTALLTQPDGSATSNYGMTTYQPGVNCTWTQDYARKALRFERRLEFAMEGYHFFDLVRWGVAADVINTYFATEKGRTPHLGSAHFTKNRDEYLPIPQNQINYSKGLYKQNPGW
ncbi:MAG TPA: RagB/SusD family nutrient uptake outer membrane protein [Dinghuibacter sp.]|uniref:RagB/SusD family nutrient uptake outer membrane protein n=1 Tax=Dinghuibacter sp. TaxID=2024697 RepID=UPI002C62773E|nr:RagB/SusD family nutrient uptake outer membrane protein [Dinghuibacter sp.]HTJ12299.1 RagB/SusD family nutrient uptake outer membrane protein [Dinghuibacter sp.]